MKPFVRASSIVVLTAVIFASCAYYKPPAPREVAYQGEAAHVTVSVDSVARWEKYRASLETNFNLKPEDALKQVIPTTTLNEQRYLNMIRAAVNLSPVQTGVSGSKTIKSGESWNNTTENGVTTATQAMSGSKEETDAVSKTSGTAGVPELGEPTPQPASTGTLPSDAVAALQSDPFLLYLTAQALYQEVKLLNSYLSDAVINKDYEAYLVRMSVHISPLGTGLPYDTNVTLAFFNATDEDKRTVSVEDYLGEVNARAQSLQSNPSSQYPTLPLSSDSVRIADLVIDDIAKDSHETHLALTNAGMPIVLPLIVRDNLEAALNSQSEARIREFGLALTLLSQGSGVGAKFESDFQRLTSVFGKNLNSLYSLSKVGENTLKVNLGAVDNGYGNSEMVTRNHNVTFVLLVPKVRVVDSPRKVRGVQYTQLVNAKTGVPLQSNTQNYIDTATRLAFETIGISPEDSLLCETSPSTLPGTLRENVLVDNYADFDVAINKDPCYSSMPIIKRQMLWTRLQDIQEKVPMRSFSFTLPHEPKKIVTWLWEQNPMPIAVQSNQNSRKATVFGLVNPARATLIAKMCGDEIGKTTDNCVHSSSISQNFESKTATIEFPSIPDEVIDTKNAKLYVYMSDENTFRAILTSQTGCEYDTPGCTSVLTKGVKMLELPKSKEESKTPSFNVFSQVQSIIASDSGTGSMVLHVTLAKEGGAPPIKLSIKGADIVSLTATPAGVEIKEGQLVVSQSSRIEINLKNLTVNGQVQINAEDNGNQKSTPLILSVIQNPRLMLDS